MSLTFKTPPRQNYFSGNPVVIQLQSDSGELIGYSVKANGETVFEGTCLPLGKGVKFTAKIDLAEIFNAHFREPYISGVSYLIRVVYYFDIRFQITLAQGSSSLVHSGRILRGGIPNEVFRTLAEKGNDIFAHRQPTPDDLFVLTTRTNGKEINLKETELHPFFYIHRGYPIRFKSDTGYQIEADSEDVSGTICAMNIKTVLQLSPPGTKRIEVSMGVPLSLAFNIHPGKLSEEKYLLKFKNSFGVFEILEVTGRAIHTPEFSEENIYETLTDLDFYEQRRRRVRTKEIIEVETGYLKRSEFPFVMDMIKSDEIYFIYSDENSFRCHVTADSVQYRHLMTVPTSINQKH